MSNKQCSLHVRRSPTLFACNSFWRLNFGCARASAPLLLFTSLALNMIITALFLFVGSFSFRNRNIFRRKNGCEQFTFLLSFVHFHLALSQM